MQGIEERVRKAADRWKSERHVDRGSGLWSSCIHESGHAVSSVLRGEHLSEVGIDDNDSWRAAYCKMDSRTVSLCTLMCGGEAVVKATGRGFERPAENPGDQDRINTMLHRMHPYSGDNAEREREKLKASGRSQARKLVSRHWAAIERVASKLYSRGSLSGDEVKETIASDEALAATS